MAQLVRTQFCYRVVRFYRVSGRRKVISVGLTREQAVAHCSRPDTRRAGVWFDGFELMPGYADYSCSGKLAGDWMPLQGVPVVECTECRRVFDLAEETDLEEWAGGHDCEIAGVPDDKGGDME